MNRRTVTLTSAGRVACAAVVAVGIGALWTGAGAARMAACLLFCTFVADVGWGWFPSRRLRGAVTLPSSVCAGDLVSGLAVVSASPGVRDPVCIGAQGSFEVVPHVGPDPVTTHFDLCFSSRGLAERPELELELRSPLGLACVRVVVPSPGRPILVWPRVSWPEPGALPDGGDGEVSELRPWRAGEPERRIHARTSARVGQRMVADREDPREVPWVVDLSRASEAEISAAAGVVLAAAERDRAVGFSGLARPVPPARGEAHTARLMELLAMLPVLADEDP